MRLLGDKGGGFAQSVVDYADLFEGGVAIGVGCEVL